MEYNGPIAPFGQSRALGWGIAASALVALLLLLLILFFFPAGWNPFRGRWEGRFQDPEGLAIDAEGNLYVADEDPGRITLLDPSGREVAHVDFIPGTDERVARGDSMAVVSPGRLIAIGRHKLHEIELSPGGAKVLRVIGERGAAPGQIEDAEGIARDSNSDIYITDEDNRRIQVFDAEGKFLRLWPVPAEPEGICLRGDRVYVTFSKESWVGCFTKDGELDFRFGKEGKGPGEFRVPDFACFSPSGELYITDQKNDRIQVFDAKGRFLFMLGGPGSEPGRFRDPEDMVFDRDGNLVVADGGNHRLQVLTSRGAPLRVIQ